MSRAIGRELRSGVEIIVTRFDDDANFAPWHALQETGATVGIVDVDKETCIVNLDDLAAKNTPCTKIVPIGYASNLVGTINNAAHVV